MSTAASDRALEAGGGVFRFAPAWVPRAFCTPGRRLRLHPGDYFPFGFGRGGIDERWLASAVRADNGPGTGPYEGLSLVVDPDGGLIPFDEFVAHHGADVIGERLWDDHGAWPVYSKFFDNQQALPFHVHHTEDKAAEVGRVGKPEAYYYPPEMNNHFGDHPVSFFGLRPGTTPEDFLEHLGRFSRGGDNRITDLAHGYRIRVGTGWDIPAGVLHAPASVCTYEPQSASDVFCMCESWSNNREVPEELLWKDIPANRRGDLSAVLELLDWSANTDPEFTQHRFMAPRETSRSAADDSGAYVEKWIVYRSKAFSAKELTIAPKRQVAIAEDDAYGAIVVAGRGSIDGMPIAAISSIRFGQLSEDEFFVSAPAAVRGVTIVNESGTEPLVILKHFGPGNRELAAG